MILSRLTRALQPLRRQRHDVAQHAVDPLADAHAVTLRLDVDVARAGAQRRRPSSRSTSRTVGGVLSPPRPSARRVVVDVLGAQLVDAVADDVGVVAGAPTRAAISVVDLGRRSRPRSSAGDAGAGPDVVERHDVQPGRPRRRAARRRGARRGARRSAGRRRAGSSRRRPGRGATRTGRSRQADEVGERLGHARRSVTRPRSTSTWPRRRRPTASRRGRAGRRGRLRSRAAAGLHQRPGRDGPARAASSASGGVGASSVTQDRRQVGGHPGGITALVTRQGLRAARLALRARDVEGRLLAPSSRAAPASSAARRASSSRSRSSQRMKSRVATSPTATRSEASSRARYSVSAIARSVRARSSLGLHPVAVGLPVLREQDQRRGVRGLQRERQGQQDERVRVPAQRRRRDDVPGDPDDDERVM